MIFRCSLRRATAIRTFAFRLDLHSGVPVYRQIDRPGDSGIGHRITGSPGINCRPCASWRSISPSIRIRLYGRTERTRNPRQLETQQGTGTFIGTRKSSRMKPSGSGASTRSRTNSSPRGSRGFTSARSSNVSRYAAAAATGIEKEERQVAENETRIDESGNRPRGSRVVGDCDHSRSRRATLRPACGPTRSPARPSAVFAFRDPRGGSMGNGGVCVWAATRGSAARDSITSSRSSTRSAATSTSACA